jgi:uncharacterized protein with PIN domain
MLSLAEYRELALEASSRCRDCGASLRRRPIEHYPHSRGWRVTDFAEKLWLYITCGRCGYGWALWKLGVPQHEEVFPHETDDDRATA